MNKQEAGPFGSRLPLKMGRKPNGPFWLLLSEMQNPETQ